MFGSWAIFASTVLGSLFGLAGSTGVISATVTLTPGFAEGLGAEGRTAFLLKALCSNSILVSLVMKGQIRATGSLAKANQFSCALVRASGVVATMRAALSATNGSRSSTARHSKGANDGLLLLAKPATAAARTRGRLSTSRSTTTSGLELKSEPNRFTADS